MSRKKIRHSKRQQKSEKIAVIKGEDLLKNSAGKLGKHDENVRVGTGTHKSKKQYDRKGKRNQQLKQSLKGYGRQIADFLLFRSICRPVC